VTAKVKLVKMWPDSKLRSHTLCRKQSQKCVEMADKATKKKNIF